MVALIVTGFLIAYQNALQPKWDLLTKPSVRVELKLNAAQTLAVQQALGAAEAEYRRQRSAGVPPDAVGGEPKIHSLALPRLRSIGKTLSPAQRKRAIEISLWEKGPNLLDYPGAREALGVDAGQCRRIARDQRLAYNRTYYAMQDYARRHHMVSLDGKPAVENSALKAMRKRRDDLLWSILYRSLTAAQDKKLNALLGRPFRL